MNTANTQPIEPLSPDQPSKEEVAAEIKERIDAGENIESILLDFKDRGIEMIDFAPQIAEEDKLIHADQIEKRKSKWAKISVWGLAIIIIIRLLIRFARHT